MPWKKTQLTQFSLWGILCLGSWGLSVWKFHPQEAPIYLHYNTYFGVDWVGPWYLGYTIPVSATLIIVLNLFFIRYTRDRNSALSHVLTVWSSIALIFLIISQVLVVLLNGQA